jgi:hypothetical protein
VLFSCYYYDCLDSDSRSLFLAAQTDKNKLFTRGRLLFLFPIPFNAQCEEQIFLSFGKWFNYRPKAHYGDSELVVGGHFDYFQTHPCQMLGL